MPSLALDYITIKGFKSIASIERLELRPINILIGANGSGKSNFIGTFSFLHSVREGGLQEYVRKAGGAEQVLNFGSKNTSELGIEISFREEVNKYNLVLKPSDDDSLYPSEEWVSFWDKSYKRPYSEGLASCDNGKEAGISSPRLKGTADWVRARLGLWRVYHVHDTSGSSPMRKTSQINDNRFLRPDGSNLAAFLYLLQKRHPDSYELIRGTLQRVAPFFDNFLLEPDAINEETIRLSWKHKDSDQYFGASTLSDGTLRFVLLATLFLQPARLRPTVILVDEPELGLHPLGIRLLAALVKQASVDSQVILSTQSPILLDHFDPEDVLISERHNNSTQLSRLNVSRLEAWLEDYSLGQLWEKNELGGRPGAE